MNLTPWRKPPPTDLERAGNDLGISFNEWANLISSFEYAGVRYSMPGAMQEEIGGNFQSLTQSAFKANGVVFACIVTRMLLFSEARFQFRQQVKGRPGNLFGTPALAPLETPWTGGTTGDLLAKMLVDADLAGNAFNVRTSSGIKRLRPDWVTIVLGSLENLDQTLLAWDADTDVVGYIYQPGGPGSGRDPVTYLADEVCHFAPIPDPTAQFRGMSWLSPVVREIMGDKAMVDHKLSFLEQGATPNVVITMDQPDVEKAKTWIDLFKRNHEGATNAYRTMFLGAGADAKVIGTNMQQLDFKIVQGHGETRIAAAARVPPIIVGLSEGLEAATYCVPLDNTEALTRDGWKMYWELAVGDELLGYDAEAGVSRWTPITELGPPTEADTVIFGNATWHAECTPNHSWVGRWGQPVSPYPKVAARQPTDWGRVETADFREGFDLLRAAPTDDECGLDIRPAEAALIGWLLTDGSIMRNNPSKRQTTGYIWQKHYQAEVAETIQAAGLAVETKPMGKVGVLGYKIPAPWLRDLWQRAELDEDNPDWTRFVLALGTEAREAFLDAGMLAEGSNAAQKGSEEKPLGDYGRWYRWRFRQNHGPVMDAFRLAAHLCGYATQMGRSSEKCGSFYCAKPKLDAKHLWVDEGRRTYVWCPQTELGNWTMRQGDIVALTGNSNYGQARRAFADATMRPLWRNAAGSLARIIQVPPGAELWFDDRDIAFLQEDQKDAAEIQATHSQSMRTLVDGGFTPDSVVDAVTSGDLSRLVHTGLFSVQLQPPGTTLGTPPGSGAPSPPPTPAPSANGKAKRDDTFEMLEGLLRMSERNQQPHIEVHVPETRVEIGEGAIQSHVSLELPAGEAHRMEIAEGAIQSHVTVEPARTEIQKGAVEVTVEPSDVTIEKGAVWVDVQPGDVNVAEGAFRTEVTVEPARIEKGAVDVTVEAPPPSDVNVTVEPPSLTLERGAVEVTVEPTEISEGAVQVTVEPAQIDIHQPEQELTVEVHPAEPPASKKIVRFERNEAGEIVEATSEDAPPQS